jgi:hypothetical protein
MAKAFDFDARNFSRMMKELSLYTSGEFKDVVQKTAKEVIHLTARRTKKTTAGKQKERLKQKLRRPFASRNGAKYYLGTNGRLWVSPSGEKAKYNWVLMKEGVKTPPASIPSNPPIYRRPQASRRKISSSERQKIRTVMKNARAYYDSKTKYNKSIRGLSQASWLHMLRLLGMKNFGASLKVASKVKLSSELKMASSVKQSGEKYKFEIELYNAVQATLNRHAGGMRQFYRSLQGKTKAYEKAIAIDQKKYMKKFADKNGFVVT